jgi:Galactose oxidase, central domain
MIRRTISNRVLSTIAALSASFLLNASIASAGCIGGFEVGPMDDAAAAPAAIADDSIAQPAVVSSKRPQTGDILIAGGVGAAGMAIGTTQLYSNATGTLVGTPPMGGPRAAQQALMFPTQNEVLVVGGFKGKAKLTGSSIVLKITTLPTGVVYHDNKGITGTFSPLKSRMQSGKSDDDRAFFPSVVLPSGLGFMPSGLCNGDIRPTAFTFNATNNLFSLVGAPVLQTRAFHTATLLPDGTVLIAGGIVDFAGDSTDTAEIFDPVAGTFTATGAMTASRAGHTATLLGDGTVLITGGISGVTGTWTALDTAEIYTPTTRTFAAVPATMTAFRWQHTATLLNDGTVLLAGGFNGTATWTLAPFGKEAGDTGSWTPTSGAIEASTEIYNPATGVFTAGANMAGSRFGHTATLLIAGPNAGDVLMVGGFGGTNPGAPLKTTELYNFTGATFSAGPTLRAARAWHTATVIQLPTS